MNFSLLVNKIDELFIIWGNKLVGNIFKNLNTRDITFQYDRQWLDDVSVPISLSLPLREAPFAPLETKAFFSDLIPSNISLKSLCEYHKLPENDIFTLLTHFGKDCPGALIFANQKNGLAQVDHDYADITDLLHQGFRHNDFSKLTPVLHVNSSSNLTDAQYKLPLVYDNGKFLVPSFLSFSPTSHILKFSSKKYKNICLNEAFCLEMAKYIKLPVPDFEVLEFNDNFALLIDRVDRLKDNRGKISRLHQENFCQALGNLSQGQRDDSSIGYRDCYNLIRGGQVRNSLRSMINFIKLTIFNILIGNSKQNARGFSVIYHLEQTKASNYYLTVSPFSDLSAARVYQPVAARLGMPIGRADYFEILDDVHYKLFLSDINTSVETVASCLSFIVTALKEFFIEYADQYEFYFNNPNLFNRLKNIFAINSLKLINIIMRLNNFS